MSFPLWKLFLIVAVYAAFLAVLSHGGWFGIVMAVFLGTTTSSVVVLTRKNNFLSVILTVIGGILGAAVGFIALSPCILAYLFGYDHGFGETAKSWIVGSILGAVAGAFCGMAIARRSAATKHLER